MKSACSCLPIRPRSRARSSSRPLGWKTRSKVQVTLSTLKILNAAKNVLYNKAHMYMRQEKICNILTIKGKVTDESGWFIAGRNIQERQQLVPVLSQITFLLPRSNSWNPYNSTEVLIIESRAAKTGQLIDWLMDRTLICNNFDLVCCCFSN